MRTKAGNGSAGRTGRQRICDCDGQQTFCPNQHHKVDLRTDGGERRQKVVISQGFADEERFTIHLPEGYAVESLPQRVETSNEFGEFCSECKADTEHGTVTVSQRMTMRKGEYPPSSYASLLTLANTARKGYSAKLVLVKK